jgi:hypothetical protein
MVILFLCAAQPSAIDGRDKAATFAKLLSRSMS